MDGRMGGLRLGGRAGVAGVGGMRIADRSEESTSSRRAPEVRNGSLYIG